MMIRCCHFFASLCLMLPLCISSVLAQAPRNAVSPPANDNFAKRRAITGLSNVTGTTVGATLEPWEPELHLSRTVWYEWTVPQSGVFTVSTETNHMLQLYDGLTVDSLRRIASTGLGGAVRSPLVFRATAGMKYVLKVHCYLSEGSAFTLKFSKVSAPANDDFANATIITQRLPVTITGNNLYATHEKQEPLAAGVPGWHSLWYKWTAPENGEYQIKTALDALVYPQVFKGSTLGSLQSVMYFAPNYIAEFKATAGETFYVSINNIKEERGEFSASFRKIQRPVNDASENAIVISPTVPSTIHGTNIDAADDLSEPSIQHGRQSLVWYKWTPSVSGIYNITPHVDESMGEGWLTVFTSDPKISDQRCKVYLEDSQQFGPINFAAMAGVTYYIAIDGLKSAQGNFRLDFSSYTETLVDGGEVIVGETYEGQQTDVGEVDVWTFRGEKDEYYHLEFRTGTYIKAMPRLQRFSIRVEDEAGNVILEQNNGDGGDRLRTPRIPESGVYSITIKAHALEALGRYSFTLKPVTQEAFPISITGNATYGGNLDQAYHVHRWTFWGKAGQVVRVELQNDRYVSFNRRIVGPGGWIHDSLGSPLPDDGEYTVEVSLFYAWWPSSTSYTLRVWVPEPALPVPAEPVSAVRDEAGNTRVALNFRGERMRWIQVQTSTDLKNWTPVVTFQTAEGDSSIDVGAYPDASRFFRMVPESAP